MLKLLLLFAILGYGTAQEEENDNIHRDLYELDYMLTYGYLKPGRMFPETPQSVHNVWCRNYVGRALRVMELTDKVFPDSALIQMGVRLISLSKIRTMHTICRNPEALKVIAVILKLLNNEFPQLLELFHISRNTFLAAALPNSHIDQNTIVCYIFKFIQMTMDILPPEIAAAARKENMKELKKKIPMIKVAARMLGIKPGHKRCPIPRFMAPNPLRIRSDILALMFAIDKVGAEYREYDRLM